MLSIIIISKKLAKSEAHVNRFINQKIKSCNAKVLNATIFSATQRCNIVARQSCDIVSNGYNIVPALQRCAALKIVAANRAV